MDRSMTGLCNQQPNGVSVRNSLNFRLVSSLVAVASVLTLTQVNAEDPAETKKSATGGISVHEKAHSEAAAIPECLEKLNLTAEQQGQVKEIVASYDGSLHMVWKKFGERYMQTVAMESALLAAIEDNLTDAQRQQVRDQRRKTAKHEKALASTATKVNQAPVAVKATKEEATTAVGLAEEELAAVGISLTDEQEAAADKIEEKYRAQLRSLNRDIQGLHTRLVSLEADKLVEIEKVLTKEQLAELRTSRQSAPASRKMMTKSEPTSSK